MSQKEHILTSDNWDIGYSDIFKNVHLGIIICRFNAHINSHIIQHINPAASRFLEIDSERVVGKAVETILNNIACNRLREQMRNLVLHDKSMEADSFECNCGKKYQKCYSVKKFSLPHDAAGFILENINEKRRLEYKLIQAQKLESIATLAGGVAHDFNNLLGGMYGYIELVKQSLRDNQMQKAEFYIDRVFSVHERAKDLTRQLMSLSKDKEPVMKLTAVRPMLLEAILFTFSGSEINCQQEIPDDIFYAVIDVNQIHQVIHNLLINAQQAVNNSGTIAIEAHNIEPNEALIKGLQSQPYISISVRDNGCGIPSELQPHLFDPFFTTKRDGTGLGLSVCKSIVDKHNGMIYVRSQEGVGTEFTVLLPASHERTDNNQRHNGDAQINGGTILVLDDEEFILEIAGDMLRMLGYEPILVRDGNEAVEKYTEAFFSSSPVDLVILDLTIKGGIGGLKTLKRLAAINPDIIALVSSGYTESEIVEDYRKYGFRGVISKPYVVKDLKDAISFVLTQDR